MKRILWRTLASIGFSLSLFASLSLAAGLQDLTVGGYTLVSSQRATRTEWEYTYKANVTNSGGSQFLGVKGTLTSRSLNTVVVDGRLSFGDVPAIGAVASADTFTIRQNRSFPFSWADLSWALSGNIPPMASFTATPGTGPAPLDVRLDASASTDPDGTIHSYAWDFGDGQTGTGTVVTHAFTEVKPYTVALAVMDNMGAKSPSVSRTITVTEPPNHDPIASFTAAPNTGTEPLTVQFDASASSDVEGPIASYQWAFGDGDTATGPTPTHEFTTVGNYSVTLTVTDGNGATPHTQKTITVLPKPLPDSLALSFAGLRKIPDSPALAPATVQAGKEATILAIVRLPGLPASPQSASLELVEPEGSSTTLCALRDDGVSPDQAVADGVWTCRFKLLAATVGTAWVRGSVVYPSLGVLETSSAAIAVATAAPPWGPLALVKPNQVSFVDPSTGAETSVIPLVHKSVQEVRPIGTVEVTTDEVAIVSRDQRRAGIFTDVTENDIGPDGVPGTDPAPVASSFRVNDAGGIKVRIDAPPGQSFSISIDGRFLSRDGSRFALVSEDDKVSGGVTIAVYDLTGRPLYSETAGIFGALMDWQVSPDGRHLLVVGSSAGGELVNVVEIDTGQSWHKAFDLLTVGRVSGAPREGGGFDIRLGNSTFPLPPL